MSENHKGKIGRCPAVIREEVCRRLADGESGAKTVAWLNAQPAVQHVCEEIFEGVSVSQSNLSEWRLGGYKQWCRRQEMVERQKELGRFAADMAAAGKDVMAAPTAIITSQLTELLEQFDPATLKDVLAEKPKNYFDLVYNLAQLQKSAAAPRQAKINEGTLALNERRLKLDEERFKTSTCELFIKFCKKKEAVDIAGSKTFDHTAKLQKLRQMMFEDAPAPVAA